MTGSPQPPAPELSVVIPVFNEEDNLEPLIKELESVLQPLGRAFEVVFIDDRSTDGSLALIERLRRDRPYISVVHHTINSGESAAQGTGFRAARGSIVITMDADQQNDPHDIPEMLKLLAADTAAVCGVRRTREDDWVRRASSRIANRFRNGVTGDVIGDAGCTFRALRRDALKEIPVFNGMHRFLPTMLRFQGYKVLEMKVNHRPRTRGKSKYGIGNRAWRGIVDCFAMRWYHARCVRGDRSPV